MPPGTGPPDVQRVAATLGLAADDVQQAAPSQQSQRV